MNSDLTLSYSVNIFTEKDFVAAFNEWSRMTNENPEGMDARMDALLDHHKGDQGAACTALIFSILHDNKRKEGHEHI